MLCVSTTPLLLHDNTPAHKTLVAKGALRVSGLEELSHPHYSSDMAPCDFNQFVNHRKHFEDDNDRRVVIGTKQNTLFEWHKKAF